MEHEADLDGEALHALLEAVKAGDVAAAQRFIDRYESEILLVVRRMRRNRRFLFDSDDYAQDVWASFFRQIRDLPPLEQPGALVNYLRMMARNKVIDHDRRARAAAKRLERRVPLRQVAAWDPALSPPLAASQAEEWQRLLLDKSPDQQRVIRLWQSGQRLRAISAATGLHIRRVRRILAALVRSVSGISPRRPK